MGRVSVTLKKQDADFHFRSFNAAGQFIDIDDATAYEDGKGNGVGPMQLLIMAIGACSAIDIVAILKKARQPLDDFSIRVDGDKPDGVSPSIYNKIAVHYDLSGALDANKVRRAIDLSLGKYCSVARILEKSAEIEYSFSINDEQYIGSPLMGN